MEYSRVELKGLKFDQCVLNYIVKEYPTNYLTHLPNKANKEISLIRRDILYRARQILRDHKGRYGAIDMRYTRGTYYDNFSSFSVLSSEPSNIPKAYLCSDVSLISDIGIFTFYQWIDLLDKRWLNDYV